MVGVDGGVCLDCSLSLLAPPAHTAILRIGCILQARGQVAESTDQFKDALGIDEASADTWILIANQDLAKNAHKNARGSFERVLKKIEPRDVYSLLAIGNDKLLHGRSEPKPDVRADIYKEAVKCFDKVLRIDPKNAYAAHGLGIALAETGHPSEAKEVLLAVCEAAPNLSSAQLSLAHVNVELGQYDSAIALVWREMEFWNSELCS